MGDLLRISVDCDGGVTVVRCAGEIDISNVSELAEAVAWSMTCDLRALRIDMTEVGFIDSQGIGTLLAVAKQCDERGVEWELVESAEVERVLSLVGMEDVIAHRRPD
jgi:anti-sigma B factor antagonist